MKFRKNKKGFTIVELIIVIAVIGILTAVMVPTIIHLVGKANKASDDALVSNLNKASQLREAELGKPETMHDAVLGLEDYGYKLDALVAKSEQPLIYNLESNRFALANDVDESDYATCWRIQTDFNSSTDVNFNIYAGKGFAKQSVSGLKVGFDAGEENVSEVEYVGTRNVIIRTNGGCKLTVNAPLANVDHYDDLASLTISAVKGHSYHEYGNVAGNVIIASGHFVLEDKAFVNTIIVDDSQKGEGAEAAPEVEAVSGSEVGTVVVNTVSEGTKISFEEGATVTEVAPGTEAAKEAMSQAGQEIAKGATVSEEVIDTSSSSQFAGGLGTENSPYLLANEQHVLNMNSVIVSNYQSKRTYFKAIGDIKMERSYSTSPKSSIPYLWNGELDLGGKTIELPDSVALIYSMKDAVVKNGTIENLNQCPAAYYCQASEFESVKAVANTLTDDAAYRNEGVFVTYAYGNILFNNCVVAGSFITGDATGNYNALFVGYAFYNGGHTLEFKNCINEATMSGGRASIFVGNIAGNDGGKAALAIKVQNFRNEGSVRYTFVDASTSPFIAMGNANGRYSLLVDGVETNARTLTYPGFYTSVKDSTLGLVMSEDQLSVVEASATGVTSYTVSYGVYVNMVDEEGTKTGTDYVAVSFDMSADSLSSIKVLKFVDKQFLEANSVDVTELHAGDKVTVGNVDYYYIGAVNSQGELLSTSGVAVSARRFSVAAYDANSVLVATAAL